MENALGSIASIRSGISFRETIRHVEGGCIAIVQAGDIDADGVIDTEGLLRVVNLPMQKSAPLVAVGDVLLQSRGLSYRAGVVPSHAKPIVATASVLVISPGPAVRPAYLAHFLNDPVTQAELRTLATGATIANLKRSSLEQLQVLVPSIEDQERIVAYGETLREISRLETRLAELRRTELRALLEECSKRNRKRVNAPGS
ncbi:MAG: restriction endonuclease subunit S [Hyphomicrobiaceae bacterium]